MEDRSKKILFCGDMRAGFVRQDLGILKSFCRVRLVDFSKVASRWSQLLQFIIKCLTGIPDVVWCDLCWVWFADYPAVPFIVLSKVLRKRTVVCVGDFEILGIPEIGWGNQLKVIRGAVSRWILRNADVLVAPSSEYQKLLVGFNSNSHTIPEAIDTSMCDTELPEKRGVITTYCSEGMDKRKGLHVFREVAKISPYEFREFRNLPRPQFIEELKHAQVFCQLSYTEAFGVTVAEAMALGCVPVVTDRGALPWLIGDSGVIVPYGDILATQAAIQRAMTMDGTKARERAREFSPEKRKDLIKRIINAQ